MMYPSYPYYRMGYPPLSHPYVNNYVSLPDYSPPDLSRRFPAVNPVLFMSSAQKISILLKDASFVAHKIATSKQFSYALMAAAQDSNIARVEQLIRSTGIESKPKINYNPDGLYLSFQAKTGNIDCCFLLLKLRWKE